MFNSLSAVSRYNNSNISVYFMWKTSGFESWSKSSLHLCKHHALQTLCYWQPVRLFNLPTSPNSIHISLPPFFLSTQDHVKVSFLFSNFNLHTNFTYTFMPLLPKVVFLSYLQTLLAFKKSLILKTVFSRAVTKRTIRPAYTCQVHGEYRDYSRLVSYQTMWIEIWICVTIVPLTIIMQSLNVS